MKIADAVRKAVDLGDGDQWQLMLPVAYRLTHAQPVRDALPDRHDPHIFIQLRRGWPCYRARMTHVERRDGSLRPWVILTPADFDRRAHARPARRVS
jgi:hypothetical protein